MKNHTAIVSIILAMSLIAKAGITDGLVAYYPFNGNANDESGNERNAIISGGMFAPDRLGVQDSSLSLDGIDDYMIVENYPLLNSAFTYSLWIKVRGPNSFSSIPSNDSLQSFGMLGPDPGHTWNFSYNYAGGAWDLWDRLNSSWYPSCASASPTDSWAHVAIVYTGDGIQQLFVNGDLCSFRAVTTPITPAAGRSFIVGRVWTTHSAGQPFNGWVDDIRIYNRALSSNEVAQLYAMEGLSFCESFEGDFSTNLFSITNTDQDASFGVVSGKLVFAGGPYTSGDTGQRGGGFKAIEKVSGDFSLSVNLSNFVAPLAGGGSFVNASLWVYGPGGGIARVGRVKGYEDDIDTISVKINTRGFSTNSSASSGRLKLERIGSIMNAYWNDELLFSAPYSADDTGVGLFADRWGTPSPFNAEFDDFKLDVAPNGPDYMVIDLADGPSATNYPVTYMINPPEEWTDEYKTTKLVMRRIPAGAFTMGSPSNEVGRLTNEVQHQVTITNDFYIGVFEVTQKQWERVTGNWPSHFTNLIYRDSRPVEQVSYDDIRGNINGTNWPASSTVDLNSFMGKLRARTSQALDLPTESQWEYACRAGTATALNSGLNLTNVESDVSMDAVGRYRYNHPGGYSAAAGVDINGGTAIVGNYEPNAWGLYDMHGNVLEWSLDWYATYQDAGADPRGASSGSLRVLRGGWWRDVEGGGAQFCRSAYRHSGTPSIRYNTRGLRLAMTLPPVPPSTPHIQGEAAYSGGQTGKILVTLETGSTDPVTNGLVAFYTLNATLNDSSGNDYHLTGSGVTATSNRFGQANTAARFTNGNHLKSLSSIPALANSEHTVAAWVRSESASEAAIAGYVSDEAFKVGNSGYNLVVDGAGKFAMAEGRENMTGTVGYARADTAQGGDNLWHFLVGVRSGNTARIYVDGVLQSGSITNEPAFDSFCKVYIGSDSARHFTGVIDDVCIYNRALAGWEIQVLYHFLSKQTLLVNAPGPSSFIFSNLSHEVLYTLDAFIDVQSNGTREAWEPYVSYSNNPINMGVWDDTGIVHLTLQDPDLDGDGLAGYLELFTYGTTDDDRDFDNDGFDDNFEASHSQLSPTNTNVDITDYIRQNSQFFDGIYSSNSVGDLAMGEVILAVSNQMIRIYLNIEESGDLFGDWAPVGPVLMWERPAASNVYYYRFNGR